MDKKVMFLYMYISLYLSIAGVQQVSSIILIIVHSYTQ